MLNFLRGLRALFALAAITCLLYMVCVLFLWAITPTAVLDRAATLHLWLIAFMICVVVFQLLRRPINQLDARQNGIKGTPLIHTMWKL
jgi:hypothetical protein